MRSERRVPATMLRFIKCMASAGKLQTGRMSQQPENAPEHERDEAGGDHEAEVGDYLERSLHDFFLARIVPAKLERQQGAHHLPGVPVAQARVRAAGFQDNL